MSRRSRKTGILDLSRTINAMFVNYGQIVSEVIDDSLKEVARESVEDLKAVGYFSPKGNPSGEYSKSWTWDIVPVKRYIRKNVVYNLEHYRLTHLLESGHSKYLWGRATGGTVRGYPHIKPVADKANEHLESAVIKRIENINADNL